MKEVCRAHDTKLDRDVALTVLLDVLATPDGGAVEADDDDPVRRAAKGGIRER